MIDSTRIKNDTIAAIRIMARQQRLLLSRITVSFSPRNPYLPP